MKNLHLFGDFIIPKNRRAVECANLNQMLVENRRNKRYNKDENGVRYFD